MINRWFGPRLSATVDYSYALVRPRDVLDHWLLLDVDPGDRLQRLCELLGVHVGLEVCPGPSDGASLSSVFWSRECTAKPNSWRSELTTGGMIVCSCRSKTTLSRYKVPAVMASSSERSPESNVKLMMIGGPGRTASAVGRCDRKPAEYH